MRAKLALTLSFGSLLVCSGIVYLIGIRMGYADLIVPYRIYVGASVLLGTALLMIASVTRFSAAELAYFFQFAGCLGCMTLAFLMPLLLFGAWYIGEVSFKTDLVATFLAMFVVAGSAGLALAAALFGRSMVRAADALSLERFADHHNNLEALPVPSRPVVRILEPVAS